MLKVYSRAKINWTLDITGQRSDGYHLMDMLMQPVTLHDVITLNMSDTITLTTSGTPYIAPDDNHLALRAARALACATHFAKGAAIHVHKQIPAGAGMGGGSADAAGVLLGLNQLWETGLTLSQLQEIGLTLGADVPFCLRGGLTRTTGIGEKMENLPSAPCWPLVIIQPCEGLSTGSVFKAYHRLDAKEIIHPKTEDAIRALQTHHDSLLTSSLFNVLQPVSEKMRPEISSAIASLEESGAFKALMTGSGSAVFGVFHTMAEADSAYQRLREVYDRCFICETTSVSNVIEVLPSPSSNV